MKKQLHNEARNLVTPILVDLVAGIVGFILGFQFSFWLLEELSSMATPSYVKGNMGELAFIPFAGLGGLVLGITLGFYVHRRSHHADHK